MEKPSNSDKFWSIETSGTSYTVTYGKTGTAGQTSIKEFDTEEKCMKEAEKLVSEKVKKGYAENGEESSSPSTKSSDYLKEWEELVKAKDLHQALTRHFSYLADSPGYEKFPEAIMQKAKGAYIKNDCLVIQFEEGELIASAPGNTKIYKAWPKSFQKIISQHETLFYPEVGWALCLANPGNFDSSFLADESIKELDILCPLSDFSDWWIYHPKTKNKLKEPAICFVSHDDGEVGDLSELNAGAIFLSRMKELLNLEIDVTSEKNDKLISSISLTPLVKLSRCVRKGLIHQNELVTIEPQLAKERWEYYPESIHRIAIYDITNPKIPVLKSYIPLDFMPFDMCLHENLLYVFTAGIIETQKKFVVSVYDLSSQDKIRFVKELYSEITSSDKVKMDSVTERSFLLIQGNYLLFSLMQFDENWNKAENRWDFVHPFEIKVYDLVKNQPIVSHFIKGEWPNEVMLFDNKIFQFVSEEICEVVIKDNTIDLNSILRFEGNNTNLVYASKGAFIYFIKEIKYKDHIICIDKNGKELSKTKYPGSVGVNRMWVWNNVLILNTGYFFSISQDGSLALLKSDWKLRDTSFINNRNRLSIHKNLLLIPLLTRDKTPGKEFEFQMIDVSLN